MGMGMRGLPMTDQAEERLYKTIASLYLLNSEYGTALAQEEQKNMELQKSVLLLQNRIDYLSHFLVSQGYLIGNERIEELHITEKG